MNAIRQFIEVKNNSFSVVLPEGFTASRVEVIIIPSDLEDEIPQWQKDVVLGRIEAIEKDSNLLIDEDQFWKDLDDAS